MQLNTGQTGGPAGRDINVVPAWMQGFTGKGVVVGVVDDGKLTEHVYSNTASLQYLHTFNAIIIIGLDKNHTDLSPNYVRSHSYN